jgi:hypothetical protein
MHALEAFEMRGVQGGSSQGQAGIFLLLLYANRFLKVRDCTQPWGCALLP